MNHTSTILVAALLAAAARVAAQERIAVGGPMRSSTGEVAFAGWFVGGHGDIWRVEPFDYLAEDAGVWTIVPFWRGSLGRGPGAGVHADAGRITVARGGRG